MSLIKRLEREAKANPAKAGGLAVLLVVAGYFWAPLVKGFISHDSPDSPSPPPATATPAPAPVASVTVPSAEPPKAPDSTGYDWQKVAQLLDEDTKMRSVAELPNDRDPFKSREIEPLTVAPVKEEEDVKARLAQIPAIEPRDAGLVLSSTFVGPLKQIALIGGKPYRVGDRVRAEKGGIRTSFKIVDVQPRLIVLERNGKQYQLAITRAGAGSKDDPVADDEADELDEDAPEETRTMLDESEE